jgi:hypothetical protein
VIAAQVEQGGDLVAESDLRARPHVDEVAAQRISDDVEPFAGGPIEAQHRHHQRQRCNQQEKAVAGQVKTHG